MNYITNPKEALDYINQHREGTVKDLEKVIDSEVIKMHQVGRNLFVDIWGRYKFTKENIRNYKFIYGGKMNVLDKAECFFGNIFIAIYEFLTGDRIGL